MKKFILVSFLLGIVFVTTECKKNSTSNTNSSERTSNQRASLNTALDQSADSTLADSLINHYGLVYLTSTQTQGMQIPSYSSYSAASVHIDSVLQGLNQTYDGSTTSSSGSGISRPTPNFMTPTCDNGNFYSNLSGSGGMFSSFQATYSVSGGNVSNIDLTALGTPIGWSWSQIRSIIYGSSGCTYGTITWGLQVGNLTIGYIQSYHFSWSINPSNCTFSWSQGSGLCT